MPRRMNVAATARRIVSPSKDRVSASRWISKKSSVPADAPPLFVALAADDPFFANGGFGLIESWRAAKRPAEFHLYEQGGHGFGMYPKETTSTGWFNAFVSWLTMHGMVKPQA